MKLRSHRTIVLGWAACVLIPAVAVLAQVQSATLTGSITDGTGAAIPAATVAATDIETGVTSTAISTAAGLYRIESLLRGTYRVTVKKDGFKSSIKDDIILHAQDSVVVNFALDVGSVTESVSVTSAGVQLELEDATVSQVIEGAQVENAPLNGRNVMNLIALTPGVVPQGATSGSALGNQAATGNYTNPAGWGNYQIGGGVAGDNASYLDGAPLNLQSQNWLALVPTQDSIQEFRVQTNNIGSDYGRYYGGVVNFTTKSGTENFHGTAYEYLRNTVLDANAYFNNESGVARPPLIQNQYGFALGGPILNKKLFFFGGWEGYSNRSGIPYAAVVPTVAETTGNFTGDAPIYNLFTGTQVSCNGVLNTVCPDPTALEMSSVIKYWPAPNVAGAPEGAVNFQTNASAGSNSNQYVVRGDYIASDKQQVFARYSVWRSNTLATNYFHNALAQPNALINSQQAVISHTYAINASTVTNVRASYRRFGLSSAPPTLGHVNLSDFGPAYAAIENEVNYQALPIPFLIGYSPTALPILYVDVIQYSNFNNYDLNGNLSKTLGRHVIEVGGTGRRIEGYYSPGTIFPTGFFIFYPGYPTTNVFANFMLGQDVPFAGSLGVGTNTGVIENYQAYYVKDVYQATRNLTLTAGLRWELPGGFEEKHNLDSVFLPNIASPEGTILNPATGTSQTLKGNLELVDSPEYPSRIDDVVHHHLFAPTAGFTYRLFGNTVIRGGFGIAFPALDSAFAPPPVQSPINTATTTVTGPLSNPFELSGGAIATPLGRSPAYSAGVQGLTLYGRVPGSPYPYVEQWNFNIQQQVGKSSVVQVGYLGSRGLHLTMQNNINQVPDSAAAQAEQQYNTLVAGGTPPATAEAETFLNVPVANPLAGQLAPASAYNGATIATGQLLRPYPQFANITNMGSNLGSSNYESLQASYQKRFGAVGVFMASYTWAKVIGTVDTATVFLESSSVGAIQDYNNLRADRSIESFDVPQRLVLNYTAQLPFGKGQKILGDANRTVSAIVSGWKVSGITSFQSGFPVAMAAATNALASNYGAGTIRPNYVAGCNRTIGGSAGSRVTNGEWFNTACFQQPGPFSFGNEGRVDSTIRSQGVDNWDLSVARDVAIRERLHLSFEGEFLNAFNRIQFGSPGSQLGSTTFGVVTSQSNNPRQIQFALRLSF